jgi:hypothetical protein
MSNRFLRMRAKRQQDKLRRIREKRVATAPVWPKWLKNAETGEERIFNSEDEVPEGWVEDGEDVFEVGGEKEEQEGAGGEAEAADENDPYADKDNKQLSDMLRAKKVQHNPKWDRAKLIELLKG